jgi:hypothetical protein
MSVELWTLIGPIRFAWWALSRCRYAAAGKAAE